MNVFKIQAGDSFPSIEVQDSQGQIRDLSKRENNSDWLMLVVYRGRHCPMCTRYLNNLEGYVNELADIGVKVAAVSGDSAAQLQAHKESLDVSFPLYYSLTVAQMQQLGLYISNPRSEKETDHPFAEPGLFVVNEEGLIQVVDISNNPFVRPDPKVLTSGLKWIRDPSNNYPIRGTRDYA
ncbi:redoxin domain-containing protein [Spongiibacter taiwanensis]|uniref:redoxin domain-containing protein n=1 Tax=Spongiibacter taiwanensis TaxID=1748242 RepID=UPI00203578A2|nr:redoxin domain-containing protein [Spongiibacter taiwanensis]USA42238.1 redoxin domain-containing protein [Spongiibacter taiwanensis]